jgi:hypothetical protein
MAVTALALASTTLADGKLTCPNTFAPLQKLFQFLDAHNRELLNDDHQNILDDYCASMVGDRAVYATHNYPKKGRRRYSFAVPLLSSNWVRRQISRRVECCEVR